MGSCFAEERRAEEAQSVFESNPAASVADVSSTTAAEGTSGELSVFESTPVPSSAAVRCFEEVVAENADNCTFESCPAKSSAAVTPSTRQMTRRMRIEALHASGETFSAQF